MTMESSTAAFDDKVTVEASPEMASDDADHAPSPFQFLLSDEAFGLCDVNGECF